MCLVFTNLPSYLPWLASGLVPDGQRYYGGSDSWACLLRSAVMLRSPCLSRLNFRTFRRHAPYCHFTHLGLTRYCLFTVRVASPTCGGQSATRSRAASGSWCEVRGSRFARTLPDRLGRIAFTCVTDCSFASSCFPPFLLKTQLPSATER